MVYLAGKKRTCQAKSPMKAAVLTAVDNIVYTSAPDPVLQKGDLMLKVKAATVCGTDIRILRGRKTAGIRYPFHHRSRVCGRSG